MRRADFAIPGGLERFGRDLTDPDLDDEVASAWLELIGDHRTTTTFRGPIVSQVRIGVNSDSEPLVWLVDYEAALTPVLPYANDIHDRYLITDLIGISLPYGFGTTVKGT